MVINQFRKWFPTSFYHSFRTKCTFRNHILDVKGATQLILHGCKRLYKESYGAVWGSLKSASTWDDVIKSLFQPGFADYDCKPKPKLWLQMKIRLAYWKCRVWKAWVTSGQGLGGVLSGWIIANVGCRSTKKKSQDRVYCLLVIGDR